VGAWLVRGTAGTESNLESWPGNPRGRFSRPGPGSLVPPGLDLAEWPIHVPPDWEQFVCTPLTERELEACRLSVARGRPFGSRGWQRQTAQRLGLEATLRPHGRPRRHDAAQ
jgi:hypothetical protein